MAPLDWDLILSYPLDNVNDDLAEQLFDQLLDYGPEEENDVSRLKRLFEVTRSIMQIKALQADVAVEELEQMAKREGILGARKERELQSQIDSLKKQLARRDSDSFTGSDGHRLNEENTLLQQKNDRLVETLREKESYIENLKLTNETQLHMIAESEKHISSLRAEIEQLREELSMLHDQQERFDTDVESSREQRHREQAEKLKVKNQQILHLMDENKELEDENTQLKEEILELKSKLEESIENLKKITSDCVNLNEALAESRNKVVDLEKVEQALRAELDDVHMENRLRLDIDDEIMDMVTQRIEEWKQTYTPPEVFDLRAQVKDLEMQLAMHDTESEKLLVTKLNKTLQAKEEEVQILKSQLEQATKDIESNLALINELKSKLSGVGLPVRQETDSAQDHILKLESLLLEKSSALTTATNTIIQLEDEAKKKDKEMSEIISRMRQYEMGVYGLPEAVAEIKDCRSQIRIRDKHIEELVQQINQAELLIGELLEENEDFREKLGLELKAPSVDESSKQKYQTRWQKERSLNIKLQSEIEKLEEEKLSLKEELHRLRKSSQNVKHVQKETVPKEVESRFDYGINETEELKSYQEVTKKLQEDCTQLQSEVNDLQIENKELQLGMKEILSSIKDQDEKSDVTILSPALDRLLQFIEIKQVQGNYDATLTLKSELDQLKGHNDELRLEVKRLRLELINCQKETSELRHREQTLQDKTEQLKQGFEKEKSVEQSSVALETSHDKQSDVYLQENQKLLQEIQEKEEQIAKLRNELEATKKELESSSLAVPRQIRPNYQDYFKEKEQFERDLLNWKEEKREFEETCQAKQIKAKEWENLVKVLESDGDEQKRSLGELARKVTIMKINEGALRRRFLAMSDLESSLRKENSRLKREFCEFEASVIEQLGYFQRQNESLKYKLKTLHNEMENSVAVSEFEKINKLYSDLKTKHMDLLTQYNYLQERVYAQKKLEHSFKEVANENARLKLELENAKSKIIPKELEEITDDGSSEKSDKEKTPQNISLLEMQLTNETQKARLAALKAEQMSATLELLEVRNLTLEENVQELTKANSNLQNENRLLKEQLSTSITSEVHKQNIARIKELEGIELALRQDNAKLMEMVEIAQGQARMVEQARFAQEKESATLRNQLLEFQSADESSAEKGHLLHRVLTLQLSESSLSEQLEKAKNDVLKLQAQVLRLRQACDGQEQTLFDSKLDYEKRIKSLSKLLFELQQKYSDSLTARKHEKLLEDVSILRKENATLRDQLDDIGEKYCEAKSTIAGLQAKTSILEKAAQKEKSEDPGTRIGLEHLISLETARRNELRAVSRAEIKEEEVKHQKALIKILENKLGELEVENASLETEVLEKEIRLQQVELDKSRFLHSSSDQFESSTETEPEKLSKSHENFEVSVLRKKLAVVEDQLREAEKHILERDKIITTLRAQVPTSDERLPDDAGEQDMLMGEMSKQALKVAQATIECLQTRLAQKEESVACYRELLNQARVDYSNQLKQSEKELHALQEQLRSRDNSSLAAIRKKMSEVLSKPRVIVELREREDRISQLEEMLSQEEFTIAELTEKLDAVILENKTLKHEIESMSFETHQKVEEVLKDKISLEKEAFEASEKASKLEDELNEKVNEIRRLQEESESLRQELNASKEQREIKPQSSVPEVPGPSVFLRGTVEKLKNQLVKKEKQLQALSKALTDLKADMVASAQENLRSDEAPSYSDERLQRLVDQRTSELQATVSDLESSSQKLKRDLKASKDEIDFLNNSIKYLQDEVERKSSMVDRLVSERSEMQKKVEGMRATVQQQESETSVKNLGESREVEQLRHQIFQLEEQLQRQEPAEKPYDQSREQVVRWEESKKWQRTTEQLRAKLKEKQKEIELLQRNGSRFRDQVIRVEKEKSILENKVKNLSQLIAVAGTTAKDAERLELQKKNVELEKEVHSLKVRLNAGSEETFQEMAMRNKILLDKVEELEREIIKLRYERDISRLAPRLSSGSADESLELKQKMEELDLEVLKLTEENFNLRLQLEHAKTSNPQLQQQITLLEKELEILKSENEGFPDSNESVDHGSADHFRLFSSILNSDLEDLGTSELKLMILALRKGIRKLQAENVKLKKEKPSGGHVSTRRDLSATFDRESTIPMEQTDRTSSPKWRDVAEQRIAKVIQENTRLAKELKAALQTIDNQRAEIEVLTFDKQKMAEKVDLLLKEIQNYEKMITFQRSVTYK